MESSSPELWKDHLQTIHECLIPLSQLQAVAATAKKRKKNSVEQEVCPLCLACPGASRREFTTHVGRHMEEIALMALPRETDEGSDSSSSLGSENSKRSPHQVSPIIPELVSAGAAVSAPKRATSSEAKTSVLHAFERPEKCPIVTCDYHHKGFARKYDKNRHTLTHYKGTMVCGFCPGSSSSAKKSFNRADMFKQHLTSVHNVEQTPANSRKKSPSNTSTKKASSPQQNMTGKCSTCSTTFNNTQEFYEHLDDCVLRVVQQEEPSETINEQHLTDISNDPAVRETVDRHMLPTITANYIAPEDTEEEEIDPKEESNSDDNWSPIGGSNDPKSGKSSVTQGSGPLIPQDLHSSIPLQHDEGRDLQKPPDTQQTITSDGQRAIFQCDLCATTALSQEDLERHLSNCHVEAAQCGGCGRLFSGHDSLVYHENHHGRKNSDSLDRSVVEFGENQTCGHCDGQIINRESYDFHERQLCLERPSLPPIGSLLDPPASTSNPGSVEKLERSPSSLHRSLTFTIEGSVPVLEKSFTCEHCCKTFADSMSRDHHMIIARGRCADPTWFPIPLSNPYEAGKDVPVDRSEATAPQENFTCKGCYKSFPIFLVDFHYPSCSGMLDSVNALGRQG